MDKLDRQLIRKMIIQEAMMIKKQKTLSDQNIKIARWCAQKEKTMLSEGYSRTEVNEGIIGDLLGLAGDTVLGAPGGFIDTIEQMLIEKLLKKLFGSYDPDSFVGAVVANVIENIDITEISKYFGTGACDPIVDMIFKGISEALIQKGLSKLFGDRSSSNMITATMREAFTNALNSTEFQVTMKQGIKDVVCTFDFSSVLSSLKTGFGSVIDSFKSAAVPE
tara:strand:- start:77 stop:739 length:663 start_codon:yes stop_codon:yes gene_type:complete